MTENTTTSKPSITDTLCQIISGIAHPLIVPSVCTVALLWGPTPWHILPAGSKWLILTTVALGTYIIPISCIPILMIIGLVKSIRMHSRAERRWPLIAAAGTSLCAYITASRLGFPLIITTFLLTNTILTIMAIGINGFWKISLHMTGMGGMAALMLTLGLFTASETAISLPATFVVAGLVGSARLQLGAHTPAQVWTGFAMGFAVTAFLIFARMLW